MPHYDAIVVGLGCMGSAVLDHLARRRLRVLGIDQFSIGHDRGSSHGQTRIIRRAYFEHPDYVPLVDRSRELWQALEQDCGTPLIHTTGLLMLGRPEGELITGVRRAAQEHDLPIHDITNRELNRRFPAFRHTDGMAGLFEPDAGYLAVEQGIQAHLERAARYGADIGAEQCLVEWTASNNQVDVKTNQAQYTVGNLIFCSGAWSSNLLADMGIAFEVRRKVVVWLKPTSQGYRAEDGCPVFCFDTDDGFFYGFPDIDGTGVKVGEHSGGKVVTDPSHIDRDIHDEDVRPLSQFASVYLPGLNTQPVNHSVCMYTMTADANFVVDRHPKHERVFVAAGFSGHGFKFAPIVGSVLADLVIDGQTDEPVDLFSASRKTL